MEFYSFNMTPNVDWVLYAPGTVQRAQDTPMFLHLFYWFKIEKYLRMVIIINPVLCQWIVWQELP